jgi:DNA polymerase, archaea type
MSESRQLTDYFGQNPSSTSKISSPPRKTVQRAPPKLEFAPETPADLTASYLIGAGYDGDKRKALLKLYEPKSNRIYFWYDNTDHKPYCYSNLTPKEIEKIDALKNQSGIDHLEQVPLHDGLTDSDVKMTKIVAKDPLTIGGRMGGGSLRDILPKAWEADIKYYENYLYDRDLTPGMPYRIEKGKLVEVEVKLPEGVTEKLEEPFKNESKELRELISKWIDLFESPIPELRRVALDIEVYSPVTTRVPNPDEASYEVIAATLYGSDGLRRVLVLRRKGVEEGDYKVPDEIQLEYYDDEKELISEIFGALLDYPVVLTFNGDDFDFPYLANRARRLGFTSDKIPIGIQKIMASLEYGIHIDLYKFFFNRSLQVYAFSQKYRENTLGAVGEALIDLTKLDSGEGVSTLQYRELASYCFRDAEITYHLTDFDSDLVMKLIILISKISREPPEDITRQGVSNWIKSLMYFEHRRRGFLIPRSEDLIEQKGEATTEAMIKGKKYKGAIVVDPVPGVHFNVAVLDFASLYPSIIQNWNLSYETVRCPHKECRDNKIPETNHWFCGKRKGISSIVFGSLRDLRVKLYKKRAKDPALTQVTRNLYNAVQLTLKVMLNASYGVMGSEAFSLYCPPVAESTTAIGRYSITKTVDKARELGINVVYGDTDSIFLESPKKEDIEKLLSWAETELNLALEVDKFYRYAVFSNRKKNYLGVLKDGSVDIKGLTGKKRHIPDFLKQAFMEMINTLGQVQTSEDFEMARAKIQEIIKNCYLMLKRHHYEKEELAFKVMISKLPQSYTKTTPQHVKAAKQLIDKGYEIKPGDIISYIKVSNSVGVKPVQLATKDEIDVDRYMEYVESTFEQVLDALGIDLHAIMGKTKLTSFF